MEAWLLEANVNFKLAWLVFGGGMACFLSHTRRSIDFGKCRVGNRPEKNGVVLS